ncbi:hypothetical protein L249_3261, partial [Ophiocordyceps polyrhachis-furcata BCC 54312]
MWSHKHNHSPDGLGSILPSLLGRVLVKPDQDICMPNIDYDGGTWSKKGAPPRSPSRTGIHSGGFRHVGTWFLLLMGFDRSETTLLLLRRMNYHSHMATHVDTPDDNARADAASWLRLTALLVTTKLDWAPLRRPDRYGTPAGLLSNSHGRRWGTGRGVLVRFAAPEETSQQASNKTAGGLGLGRVGAVGGGRRGPGRDLLLGFVVAVGGRGIGFVCARALSASRRMRDSDVVERRRRGIRF